jgi:3,4-dihydroxyphthalate decarboxylase
MLALSAASGLRAQTPRKYQAERQLGAEACRMLAGFDLVRGSSGHVSIRTGADTMLLLCRGPNHTGLRFVTADAFREVNLDAKFVEEATGFQTPTEWPIHAEIYRARPDVQAVVHAHPTAIVTALAAGLTLKPVAGSYNSPGARLVVDELPIYPLSTRITTREEGQEMARVMGKAPVCLLKGHGIASAAKSLQVATLQAIVLEDLAKMNLEIAQTGATPTSVSDAELEEFRQMNVEDDGSRSEWFWKYNLRLIGE